MTEQEEMERGRLAREVLESPAFKEAFAQLHTEIVSKWRDEKDQKCRDWLWTMDQAAKRLESVLTEWMQSGQFRAHQIELERSRAEKAGATLRRVLGR